MALADMTQAPQVADYPPESHLLTEVSQQIQSEWSCTVHGTCYISSGSEHVIIQRHRLKEWAARIVCYLLIFSTWSLTLSQLASRGAISARDTPPVDLLAEWGVHSTPIVAVQTTSKPRGRNGPHPITPVPTPTPPPSTATESILALTVASATMMMNQMMHGGLNHSLGGPSIPVSKHPLSPLLDIHEELDLLVQSFGRFHGLSNEVVESACRALQDKGYSPFVLKDKELNVARIEELTGLDEGAVLGLRQFAGDWVNRQEAKRARYN